MQYEQLTLDGNWERCDSFGKPLLDYSIWFEVENNIPCDETQEFYRVECVANSMEAIESHIRDSLNRIEHTHHCKIKTIQVYLRGANLIKTYKRLKKFRESTT